MLDAYFSIKPKPAPATPPPAATPPPPEPVPDVTIPQEPDNDQQRPAKKRGRGSGRPGGSGSRPGVGSSRQGLKSRAPPSVEPYDASTVHARFKPSVPEVEPRGLADACVLDCEPLGELALEDQQGDDQYEYLWQEANSASAGQFEDDDTDSCVTFDDTASDTAEQFGSSPAADCSFEPVFAPRLKAKPSEVPVYSGPELWFEEDDFIE